MISSPSHTLSDCSTVGLLLSQKLGSKFYDGDDYHSPESKRKMAQGEPLTDGDRLPWLKQLAAIIREHTMTTGKQAIVACSALKPTYRDILIEGCPTNSVAFILLDPCKTELERRVGERQMMGTHFMPATLLESQLSSLEYDEDDLWLRFEDETPSEIVETVIQKLNNSE